MTEAPQRLGVRERLLAAANDLFYKEGIHTVGVDRILAHAGVAKGSLYATFGSKEELVRAYLAGRAARLQARTADRLAGIDDPRERAVAVFDLFAEFVSDGRYLGCPFQRACAEQPLEGGAASDVSGQHRAWRLELFTQLAAEWGSPQPARIARQLSMMYDGAAVAVGMDGDPTCATAARDAARQLIAAESPTASSARRARAT